jgi:tRNA nucleotidyltransferase (CCA-adding enzyme)
MSITFAMKPDIRAYWEQFPHPADMGIRGYGETMEIAFEQAALGLTATVCELATIRPEKPVQIRCEATDHELLLVDWLNELIYEMATRRMLFSRFQVRIINTLLTATAWGEAIDQQRHRPTVEAKGATYTELQVRQMENGLWIAQCVIDV